MSKQTNKKRNSLLGVSNAKTSKGEEIGVMTGILYLAPHTIAGRNVCPFASIGCTIACLYKAGRGMFNSVQKARIAKTKLFHFSPRAFVEMLAIDIATLVKKAEKAGMIAAVRLNGTSDLPWENLKGELGISLMERFPQVTFYDYTKNPSRAIAYGLGKLPSNYHVTFSRSESNASAVLSVIDTTCNVAAVFDTKKGEPLPSTWAGREVIDGDITDVRFWDKSGVIVGLRAKGKSGKADESGFVISTK
jgi:hypothetical protein